MPDGLKPYNAPVGPVIWLNEAYERYWAKIQTPVPMWISSPPLPAPDDVALREPPPPALDKGALVAPDDGALLEPPAMSPSNEAGSPNDNKVLDLTPYQRMERDVEARNTDPYLLRERQAWDDFLQALARDQDQIPVLVRKYGTDDYWQMVDGWDGYHAQHYILFPEEIRADDESWGSAAGERPFVDALKFEAWLSWIFEEASLTADRPVRGRKPKYDWATFAKVAHQKLLYEGGISPAHDVSFNQAALERHMVDWTSKTWTETPSPSTNRKHVADAIGTFEASHERPANRPE